MSRPFRRHLDRGFLARLEESSLRPLLDLALTSALDLQLRGKYINLYCDGQAILKLTDVPTKSEYAVEMDGKYLKDEQDVETVALPGRTSSKTYRLTEGNIADFVHEYVCQIDVICRHSRRFGAEETTAEQALIRNSLSPASPVVLIDRQVAAPGPNNSEADVVGLLRGDPSIFVLGEAKYGGNRQIRCLPCQLSDYYPMFAPQPPYLREDMLVSYREVVEQKIALGLLPLDTPSLTSTPCVECLVILCDLGDNQRLLDEAKARASICAFPTWYVRACGPNYAIPPKDEWQPLCP